MIESLGSIYNNKGQVVVIVQPMLKFYISYQISTTDMLSKWDALQQGSLVTCLNNILRILLEIIGFIYPMDFIQFP